MNIEKKLFKISTHKIKWGLNRTKKLLKACGNPEKNILSIQVAGTNGKGSTSAMLANIFQKKYKVGLFTSPHLIDFKERIRINFITIDTKHVKLFLNNFKQEIELIQPSFFEIMTVLSLWYFKKKNVDLAILETGLGGRLDSVTACENIITAFTNIDLDHQSILGKTISLIAQEKAGAITSHTQYIYSVEQHKKVTNLIKKQAYLFKLSPVIIKNNFKIKKLKHLDGRHQQINASLAFAIADKLYIEKFSKITKEDIIDGIVNASWPGRFQTLQKNPTIIFDVAHNNAGLKSFIATLKSFIIKNNIKKKFLICAFEDNKNIKQQLKKLNSLFDIIVCTETAIKKSMSCKKLSQAFNNKVSYNKDIKQALSSTINLATENDLLCIIGSHYFGPHINMIFNKSFAKI